MTTRDEIIGARPAGPVVEAEALRGHHEGRVLVVLDDDPTGTQSVADLPVLLGWTPEDLVWAFGTGAPAVYVMTNSRSLSPEEAARINREVAVGAFTAADRTGLRVSFVSRSDSTLRGHFPLETDILDRCVQEHDGAACDAVVIVPAFPDAGRITVGSIHYAGSVRDGFTPVAETEFARDATFGYRSSDLRQWVQEKTGGGISAEDVLALPLETIRQGPDAVASALTEVEHARPVVCDATDENDLRLLALGLQQAERAGKRLLFRVGPPFVRAWIGQEARAPLTAGAVRALAQRSDTTVGGLVVVGSHVELTTRQLDALREQRSFAEFELDVQQVLGTGSEAHVTDLAAAVGEALTQGDVVLRTTRALTRGADATESLDIARRVSDAVVVVVSRVLASTPPRFVVAKGGITSSDVASRGLGIRRATVVGPMLPGIVSLWEPQDGPARSIPFVVFAGNVGDEQSLVEVVGTLG